MENLKSANKKWFISKKPKGVFDSIEISCDDYCICETITADEDDLKNAKLIASSPDLLEACIIGKELCDKLRFPTEEELRQLSTLFNNVLTKSTK